MTRRFRIWEPKVSKWRKLSLQVHFSFLVLGGALGVSGAGCKGEVSSSSPKQNLHSTNTLEHAMIILKYMIIELVFMKLLSLNRKCNPHQL